MSSTVKTPSLDPKDYDRVIDGKTFTSTLKLDEGDDNVLIINSTFRDIDGHGLELRNVENVTIYNSTFEDISGTAIRLRSSGSTDDVSIVGNNFENIGKDGISAAKRFSAGVDHTDLLIYDNTLHDTGTKTQTNRTHGIYVQSSDATIVGNKITGETDANGISIRGDGLVADNYIDIVTGDPYGAGIKYFSDHKSGDSKTLTISDNVIKGDNLYTGVELKLTNSNKPSGMSYEDWAVNDFIIAGNEISGPDKDIKVDSKIQNASWSSVTIKDAPVVIDKPVDDVPVNEAPIDDKPANDTPVNDSDNDSESNSDVMPGNIFIADTNSDKTLTEIKSGDYIDTDVVSGKNITLYVTNNGTQNFQSVKLTFGNEEQVENLAPYALFGDSKGDFKGGLKLSEGQYELKVEYYSEKSAGGKLVGTNVVKFNIGENPLIDNTPENNFDELIESYDRKKVILGEDDDDNLQGAKTSDLIIGGDGDDYIDGNRGNDFIIMGDGKDTVKGGRGEDTFYFEKTTAFNDVDKIKDFNPRAEDAIDISELLTQYNPLDDTISDFVKIVQKGKNSQLFVDVDGSGENFVQIAVLENVKGLTNIENLVSDGNLIVV